MIFISGVHGVGKTFFTKQLQKKSKIKIFTASDLIERYKKVTFSKDKVVSDIEENQDILLKAILEKNKEEKNYLLDGHFCLIGKFGNIERIPYETYEKLNPQAILLLTENPKKIAERRLDRDGIIESVDEIQKFQEMEEEYAYEVAHRLGIKLFISRGCEENEKAIDFIMKNF